jgi:hypothetical protein
MTRSFRPYAPRPVRFRGLEHPAGYRIKRYDIAFAGPFRETDFADGLRLAFASLPAPAVTADRPGVGFVIAHQGNGADYVVLGWWDRENELPVRVFVRPQAPGGRWRPARENESVCVWDIEVIWSERQAYVQTVLGGGDVDGYLAIRASGAASAAR